MKTRREFLTLGALGGFGALVLSQTKGFSQAANTVADICGPRLRNLIGNASPLGVRNGWRKHRHRITPRTATFPLTKFIDELPIPPTIRPQPGRARRMVMTEFYQQLHKELPPTYLWGYEGMYPGPTIEARSGQPFAIEWKSYLPTSHFLPVDHKVHGAGTNVPDVRNVVHLHGAKIMPESDGHPEAWFTSDGRTGPMFNPRPYEYPNDQRGSTLWYHDHTLGITRLNVYSGLEGFYILRDQEEERLNLPRGRFEIPLLIQDRMFNPDGSLNYPIETAGTLDYWIPEFFGDTVLVNGKVWPYLEVEPRKYRFRFLNGSNARFYHMTLVECDDRGNPNGQPGPVFNQIGSDGGLLNAPVQLTDLLMGPAERYDVVIDFSQFKGANLLLTNDGLAPYPDGDDVVPPDIMMFKVGRQCSAEDRSDLPTTLSKIKPIDPTSAVQERTTYLSELDRASDGYPIIGLLDGKAWDDPVTETPQAGTVEIWNMVNTTGDAHPKHIHLVQFQVLDRTPFDLDAYDSTGEIVVNGPSQPADPNEQLAWKDTVKSYPGTITRVIAKFDMPTGAKIVSGKPYKYVWHCHILEHEDNEMMRPMDVIG